jgi:hypothetical protein
MHYTLEDKFKRIDRCSMEGRPYEVGRNLLHADVACLAFGELCEAVCRKIEAPTPLRLALGTACCGSSGFPAASTPNACRSLSTRQPRSTSAITCFERASNGQAGHAFSSRARCHPEDLAR